MYAGRRMVPVTDPRYRQGQRPLNAGRRFPAEVLTSAEIRQLLGALGRRSLTGKRNRALIVVMWRCGLRVGEALALKPKDIDRDGGTVTVLHGKGDKRRVVGIDSDALDVIDRWLDARAAAGFNGRHPVFCTIRGPKVGAQLHSAYVRDMLKERAAKAGIEKRVHPHGLRHTHAFELSMEGVPVHVIQLQLGHGSLATTERYIRHLAPSQVVATMRARSWAEPPAASPDIAC